MRDRAGGVGGGGWGVGGEEARGKMGGIIMNIQGHSNRTNDFVVSRKRNGIAKGTTRRRRRRRRL